MTRVVIQSEVLVARRLGLPSGISYIVGMIIGKSITKCILQIYKSQFII